MRKRASIALVWLVVASMSLIVGCGDNAGSASSSATPGNKPGDSSPVTIKIMGQFDESNLAPTDQKYLEQIGQMTNAKLEMVIPPTTGYKEQLQLTLAAGDYPDIVLFPDINDINLRNAVNNGVILPLNEYLKNAPNITKYTYDESWKALQFNEDDKIYGIPRTSLIREDSFFVRKDWLERVGITLPGDHEITIDQFTDILRKFTKNDPDGNGKNDTYGFAASLNGNKVLTPILQSQFGLLGWQEAAGGTYKYMDNMYAKDGVAYKKALSYTAGLFKEGVLDPDSGTLDGNKAAERFNAGITGVHRGFIGGLTSMAQSVKKVNPNAELTYVFIKNEQGILKGVASGAGIAGAWMVTKNSKNPQKAVDVLNAMLTDEAWEKAMNGYEGIDYTLENGQKVYKESRTNYVRRNMMRRANNAEFFLAPGTPQDVKAQVLPWLDKAMKTVVISKHLDFVPAAAKKANYMDYQKQWDQTVMKILVGQQSPDSFDDLLKGWYQNGGEDYVKEMNDHIVKLEGSKK